MRRAAAKREPTGRLDDHLHPRREEAHRIDEFGVGRGQHVVDVAADDLEGQVAERLRLRAVGDRLRRVDADDPAGAERLLHIVAGLRLDTVQLATRRERAGRQRRTAQEAAAAEADEEGIERTDLVEQFLRRGALAGDHVGVIVRRNQGHAALFGKAAPDRLAVLAVTVVDHDIAAVAARRCDLRCRCVVRHHDRRRHAEQARRQRDRLRMVAGRERDDAGFALAPVEARQRIEGAAELEGAHALEVLALEEDLGAELVVGCARGQHRRAVGVAR